ncbi:subtilisin-like serine protease [Tulasnella sp. 330]|nr:subtilisin-like serine protease [Tulasnella sp. 330]
MSALPKFIEFPTTMIKVPNEYIVKFKPALASNHREAIVDLFKTEDVYHMEPLASMGGVDARGPNELTVITKQLYDGIIVKADLERLVTLRANPGIEYIAENAGNLKTFGGKKTQQLGSDVESKWALSRISNRGRFRVGNATFSYPESAGAGVQIFIVDSGVNPTMEGYPAVAKELPKGRVWEGYSAVKGEQPHDDHTGHGTWMAGIAGGSLSGVARKSELISVKVTGESGGAPTGSVGGIFKGLDWIFRNAKDKTRSIINMNGGADAFDPLDELCSKLDEAGFYVVVASGQGTSEANISTLSPTRCPKVITVGALDKNDTKPPWANVGNIMFWAPGMDVLRLGPYNPPNGSSPAAALVSGMIALYLGENARISKPRLLEQMRKGGDVLENGKGWVVPLVPGVLSAD